jgi:hypothetical protein
MALTGKALSILKQVQSTLRTELADVNLEQLGSTVLVRDQTVVNRWVRILEALAPTLVRFGAEVESLHEYAKRRTRSIVLMLSMLLCLVATVIVIISYTMTMMLKRDVSPHQKIMDVGAMVCALLAFLGVVRCWTSIIMGMLDRIKFQEASPVFADFKRFRLSLSKRLIVRYAAALMTGTGMQALLDEIRDSNDNSTGFTKTETTSPTFSDGERVPGFSSAECGGVAGGASGLDCMRTLGNCATLDNLPQLDGVLADFSQGCSTQLTDMARRLLEIKDSAERYDRPALWRCVSTAVSDLRELVDRQFDDAPDLTRDGVRLIITHEILPFFKLPGVGVRAFRRGAGKLADPECDPSLKEACEKRDSGIPSFTTAAQASEWKDDEVDRLETSCTKLDCWQKCMEDDSCATAVWECGSRCRLSKNYSTLSRNFVYRGAPDAKSTNNKVKDTEHVFVKRPPGESLDSFMVCGVPREEAVPQAELLPSSQTTAARQAGIDPWCRSSGECRVVMDNAGYKLRPDHMFSTFLGGEHQTTPSTSTTGNGVGGTGMEPPRAFLYSDVEFRGVRTVLPMGQTPRRVNLPPDNVVVHVYRERAHSLEVPSGVTVRVWRIKKDSNAAESGSKLEYVGPTRLARLPSGYDADVYFEVSATQVPSAQQQPGQAGAPRQACVKTSPGELWSFALSAGADETLRDMSEVIAVQVTNVLERYRFRINLAKSRRFMDAELSKHYGEGLYEVSLSAVVGDILRRVDKLTAASRAKAAKAEFVNAERFMLKLSTMTRGELDRYHETLSRLRTCTKWHRDYFPVYHNRLPQTLASTAFLFGTLMLSVGLIMYLIACSVSHKERRYDMESLIQRVITGSAVYIITVAVMETLLTKHSAKAQHNQNTIDRNGDALSASSVQAQKHFKDLADRLVEEPVTPAMLADPTKTSGVKRQAETTLRSIVNAIEAYDLCNPVTTSQPGMPFPVAEIVMYCVIIIVFVGMAAIAWVRIDPSGKAGNIRRLLRVRKRLLQGDITISDVQAIVECCAPEGSVWGMFVWFTSITAVIITVWFVMTTRAVVDDYESSIASLPDCL